MTAAKTTTTALVLLLLCGLLHIDTSFAQNDNNSNAGSAVLTRRVSLPKLSIYMLCENEKIEDIDFEGEIEAYYNDLLTTKYGEGGEGQDQQQQVVKDIELTATTNFDDCNLEPNMTQTRIFTNDGSVRLLVNENVEDDTDEDGETTLCSNVAVRSATKLSNVFSRTLWHGVLIFAPNGKNAKGLGFGCPQQQQHSPSHPFSFIKVSLLLLSCWDKM